MILQNAPCLSLEHFVALQPHSSMYFTGILCDWPKQISQKLFFVCVCGGGVGGLYQLCKSSDGYIFTHSSLEGGLYILSHIIPIKCVRVCGLMLQIVKKFRPVNIFAANCGWFICKIIVWLHLKLLSLKSTKVELAVIYYKVHKCSKAQFKGIYTSFPHGQGSECSLITNKEL